MVNNTVFLGNYYSRMYQRLFLQIPYPDGNSHLLISAMVKFLHHQGEPVFITALAVVLLFSILFSKNNLAVGSGISRTYGSNSQFPFHICSFHTSQNVLKRVLFFLFFFFFCLHKFHPSVRTDTFIFLSNLFHIFHWCCNLDLP